MGYKSDEAFATTLERLNMLQTGVKTEKLYIGSFQQRSTNHRGVVEENGTVAL